jgi:hypothetical protein
MYIDLIENSQVKYECLSNFQLKSTKLTNSNNINMQPQKYFIEKCTNNNDDDGEDSVLVKKTTNTDESTEFVPGTTTTTSQQFNPFNNRIEYFHECLRPCHAFKVNKTALNGFLVPQRDLYQPGDQLSFLCNDGFLAQLPITDEDSVESTTTNNTTKRISNMHILECSYNGTWFLVSELEPDVNRLPTCSPLKAFNLDPNVAAVNTNLYQSFSYTELNLRSVYLAFTIGGILIVILTLTLLMRRFYRQQQNGGGPNDFYYQNYLAQIDPTAYLVVAAAAGAEGSAEAYASDLNVENNNMRCSMPSATAAAAAAAISLAFGSIGSASSLNQQQSQNNCGHLNSCLIDAAAAGNLPSYEEAVNVNNSSNSNVTNVTSLSYLAPMRGGATGHQLVVPHLSATNGRINQVDGGRNI